jgi:CBS domain-containing protein
MERESISGGASMKCKDIMTPNPTTCTRSATAQAAALIMSEEDVGIVPIVDSKTKQLLGVVTDRDLCLDVVAAGKHPEEVHVSESLHANPVICKAEDDVEVCLTRMKEHQIRRMPIVDEAGICIGIISQKDLALNLEQSENVHETVRKISQPSRAQAA